MVRPVHDRMPALLRAADLDVWLGAPATADAVALIGPDRVALVATPVSRRVNSVANDDPACLGPDEDDRQGRLF